MRARITYANVVATLALFVALGGGAYAVTSLPPGSVDTDAIKQGAVTSSKVRDGTLRGIDFRPGEIPPGPAGDPGLSGLEVVYASSGSDSSPTKEAVAECPAGKKVTGGGVLVSGAKGAVPTQSAPGAVPNPVSWYGLAKEVVDTPGDWAVITYAVCATVAS